MISNFLNGERQACRAGEGARRPPDNMEVLTGALRRTAGYRDFMGLPPGEAVRLAEELSAAAVMAGIERRFFSCFFADAPAGAVPFGLAYEAYTAWAARERPGAEPGRMGAFLKAAGKAVSMADPQEWFPVMGPLKLDGAGIRRLIPLARKYGARSLEASCNGYFLSRRPPAGA